MQSKVKPFAKFILIALMLGSGFYFFSIYIPYGNSVEIPANSLSPKVQKIIDGAHFQIGKTLYYDPQYEGIKYPEGDVPLVRGVCTDVVIRALRKAKIDLQVLVHEHMKDNFSAYPKIWGLKKPDKNIDHRRVPNLMVYLASRGFEKPNTNNPKDYLPGDIVSWKLDNGRDHIGLVSNHLSSKGVPLIIHNIGAGARMENRLFDWKITGHYRIK